MTFLQVIMDEVGRGTTIKDGLAIAFAGLVSAVPMPMPMRVSTPLYRDNSRPHEQAIQDAVARRMVQQREPLDTIPAYIKREPLDVNTFRADVPSMSDGSGNIIAYTNKQAKREPEPEPLDVNTFRADVPSMSTGNGIVAYSNKQN